MAKFRDGYGRASDIAGKRREFLGKNYKPSADGGAADIRASCRAGEVVALRELGRFREMGEALRRLRAEPARPEYLLPPLEAEAESLAAQAPFPSGWRKSFADAL